ncbi:MAG: hypothetical protein A3H98_04710 [Bacteroidetes bacterium RIFCSPLOWO2_02_FULL_36_8]|nr:MAG: hypothetical protein A3H98_04710 [Bacteroidetes bacterium RIFCSPLOWO2_02_FULL_36_8]OFY72154.1 MAG: hypothetical protein A3G23_07275 [Bacteroidetes bacterium RIFCSPLOWO2_12_FULL_37_12]
MKTLKTKTIILIAILISGITISQFINTENYYHPEFHEKQNSNVAAYAYPPAVGILSSSKNCLSCHINNGQWKDDDKTIIDIVDKETKKSFRQPDGTFLIETKRWEQKTVLTVIGRKKENAIAVPYRNAWLYIDPSTIGTPSLSKFAPDWDVNLPMSCRLVGDKLPGYEDADITSLPMTIQSLSNAKDTEMQLQVMLTRGESVKGNAEEGLTGNYFERKVKLIVK